MLRVLLVAAICQRRGCLLGIYRIPGMLNELDQQVGGIYDGAEERERETDLLRLREHALHRRLHFFGAEGA